MRREMRRRDLDDDDDLDGVARDGEVIRTRMFLMDTARNHQPGFRHLSDATVSDARQVARTARDQYLKSLCDAWKLPRDAEPEIGPAAKYRSLDPYPDDDPGVRMRRHLGTELAELSRDVEQRRKRQHAEFSANLSNAWKHCGPGTVCHEPDPNAATEGRAGAIERARRGFTHENWRGG